MEKRVSFVISMPKEAIEASSPVISPDGRTLVFVVGSEGKRLLYVRPLGQTEAHALAGTEEAQFPFWSRDSRHYAYAKKGDVFFATIDDKEPRQLTGKEEKSKEVN